MKNLYKYLLLTLMICLPFHVGCGLNKPSSHPKAQVPTPAEDQVPTSDEDNQDEDNQDEDNQDNLPEQEEVSLDNENPRAKLFIIINEDKSLALDRKHQLTDLLLLSNKDTDKNNVVLSTDEFCKGLEKENNCTRYLSNFLNKD